MATIGKRNTLGILNESPNGLYLDGEELGPILLPVGLVPKGTTPNSKLSVFIYFDSEDRIVATTEHPIAEVGQFACLKVVGINRGIGAFLDWGLSKDLLLPFREQKTSPQVGDRCVVNVHVDRQSNRIVASERWDKFLSKYRPIYKTTEKVDLLVVGETPLGYKAIINDTHLGLLYHNEIFEPLEVGQRLDGYVTKVRPDGNIDLRRDASGYTRVAPLAEQILAKLKTSDGFIKLDDKSTPEAVRAAFDVSKKAFKQALGALYKQRLIRFTNGGFELVDS